MCRREASRSAGERAARRGRTPRELRKLQRNAGEPPPFQLITTPPPAGRSGRTRRAGHTSGSAELRFPAQPCRPLSRRRRPRCWRRRGGGRSAAGLRVPRAAPACGRGSLRSVRLCCRLGKLPTLLDAPHPAVMTGVRVSGFGRPRAELCEEVGTKQGGFRLCGRELVSYRAVSPRRVKPLPREVAVPGGAQDRAGCGS